MRISELSATSGVSVATIKYYLREGLLPEGVRTSPTRAEYGDRHLRRLGVIRALLDADVGISGVRRVIGVLEDPPESAYELLGAANSAVVSGHADAVDTAGAEELIRRMGGRLEDCFPEQVAAIAGALDSLGKAGFEVPPPVMDVYLSSIGAMAEAELAATPTDSAEAAVRYVVLGTVLVEPLLLGLRRVAEQIAAARLFGGDPRRTLDA